ncbi:MAG TPA: HAD family hydrolase [Clostridiales bacterium]|nr:HAD family hydrolase [Clostridiales bacterium]
MKTGIIFDLDGTLWDPTEQVVMSWNLVLREHETGYTMTEEILKGLMGKTIEEIAGAISADVTPHNAIDLIKECCRTEVFYLEQNGGRLYPGLKETLAELEKNYSLYIVSNCQERYIESFLSHHKMESYFSDFENHGRTNLPKGENIKLIMERNKLERAVYVGDTQGDCNAANSAGIPFIHAKYGFGNINEEVVYVNSVSELPALAENMLSNEI